MTKTTIVSRLFSTLFPPFCAGCGRPFTVMCDACYEKLDFTFTDIHPDLTPLYLDKLQAAVYYQGPIRSLIKEMKYLSVKTNAIWAGRLLFYTTNYPKADLVTSIPLHPQRLKQRGFNQAAVIGREFARLAKLNYVNILKRKRNTPHQASFKSKHKRLHALDQVFGLSDDVNVNKIKGKTILVIDDVVTTGTTLNQAAKVLKENGANNVFGLAVAHD